MKYPDMLVVTVKTEKGTYQGQGSLKSVYGKKKRIYMMNGAYGVILGG